VYAALFIWVFVTFQVQQKHTFMLRSKLLEQSDAPIIPIQYVNTTEFISTIHPPKVQFFVILSPAHGQNWERFYENVNGWHTQVFDTIRYFTFDRLAERSPLRNLVEPLDLFPFEHSSQHSNLLLAAFQRIYELNNASDWYFLAEDDTIVVKDNLEAYVDTLDPGKLVMKGKCVSVPKPKKNPVFFTMGGAGILMSRALLKEIYPYISQCREHFNSGFGDLRIGKCIQKYITSSLSTYCTGRKFVFLGSAFSAVKLRKTTRLISLHEKSPIRTKRLNEIILNQTMSDIFVVDTLKRSMSQWTVNDNGVPDDK
jgi:hypothetical protein